MDRCTLKAYAKINLGLDVTGRLPNGYHQVKMIMQSVGICDELTLEKTPEGLSMTADSEELPTDESNLVCKAARLMQETFHIPGGVRFHLKKRIPIAAGMAGGSTDAAAAMKGMNTLFRLGLPDKELMELSVSVGADVPYCILGGTALAEGIGEKLTPLPSPPACQVLVIKPDIGVSTKYVYEHLDAAGSLSHPDIDGMVNALKECSLQGILDRMGNVLETVTVPAYPVIRDIKEKMLSAGAAGSLMSGSGPTVFGIFTDQERAQHAFDTLKTEAFSAQIFLTTFL